MGHLLIQSRRPAARDGRPAGDVARIRLDVLGLLLAGATITWAAAAAASSGGSSLAFSVLVLASAGALIAGRIVAAARRLLVPTIIVGGAFILSVSTPDVLSAAPLSGPFGYANAKGAFFVQAAIAGLMLATGSRATPVRLLGVAATIAFAAVPFVVRSLTPAALILLLPAAAGIASAVAGPKAAITGCAIVFIATLLLTIGLGSAYEVGSRSGPVDRVVDSTLTERRIALWHEALVIMSDHPIAGVGIGGFKLFSPTARSDRDARWTHNSFLQQGAETGLVGLILLILIFLWGFASLSATAGQAFTHVLAAVALAALAIHACVDYVLHFPAVPLTTAALVGAATANHPRPARDT